MTDLTKNITWTNVQGTQEQIKGYVNNYARDFNVYVGNLVIRGTTVTFTTYSKISYEDLVVRLIRKRYPLNEELAILRKALGGNVAEYDAYNTYVEQCKVEAKAWITNRDKILQ